MRRVLASAVLAALMFGVSACGSGGAHADLLPMAVSPAPKAPSATPSAKPDAVVTRQVCHDAASALAFAGTNLQDQLVAIDHYAAIGDHASIMIAAGAIQTRLLNLSNLLSTWSNRPVRPSVRIALTKGVTMLQTVCSESYPGNQADIARQLRDLSTSLTRACG
jgi:hypothetical protein